MALRSSRTLIHMARPRFKPQTPEQHAAARAIRRAAKVADTADAKLWEAIRAGKDVGLPGYYMGEIANRHRITVSRHLGEEAGNGSEVDE